MSSMRARFYDPRMGRFLSADPIGFKGGSNWYRYANGNPVMLSDPFGTSVPGKRRSRDRLGSGAERW